MTVINPGYWFRNDRFDGNKGVLQILDAIQSGYRLIDTSTNYDNEGIVGKAVEKIGHS